MIWDNLPTLADKIRAMRSLAEIEGYITEAARRGISQDEARHLDRRIADFRGVGAASEVKRVEALLRTKMAAQHPSQALQSRCTKDAGGESDGKA